MLAIGSFTISVGALAAILSGLLAIIVLIIIVANIIRHNKQSREEIKNFFDRGKQLILSVTIKDRAGATVIIDDSSRQEFTIDSSQPFTGKTLFKKLVDKLRVGIIEREVDGANDYVDKRQEKVEYDIATLAIDTLKINCINIRNPLKADLINTTPVIHEIMCEDNREEKHVSVDCDIQLNCFPEPVSL